MPEDERGLGIPPQDHDNNDDFWSSTPPAADEPESTLPEWTPPEWTTTVVPPASEASPHEDEAYDEREEEAQEAAPPIQGPGAFTPRVLSKRRAATLAAVAQALLPRGGRVHESAADVGVAERLDAALASWEPEARRSFVRLISAFEWSSLFSRHLRRFSRLSPGAQQAYVRRADASKLTLRRGASDTLRFYCMNQWAATPVVESKIGFTYGCESSEPVRNVPALEVIEFPQVSADHTEECDVVVIGSGAGGAVVAK